MGFLGNLFKPKAQNEEDAERSAKLLEHLKARRGEETGKWLAMMQVPGKTQTPPNSGPPSTIQGIDQHEVLDEAPYVPPLEAQYPFLKEGGALDAAAPSRGNETVDWVNKLFTEFEHQAEKFNASATGTELILSVHLPEFTFESPHYDLPYDPNKKVSIFKGHIATLNWAMLVQGYEDKIDVYIISADEILNFTLNDIRKSQISPFTSFTSLLLGGHRIWNLGGEVITVDKLPLVAKELLGDLIRVSAGTMSEDELFAEHHVGLALGDTVAQGFAANKTAATQAAQSAASALPAIGVPAIGAPATGVPTTSAPTAGAAAPAKTRSPLPTIIDVTTLATWSASDALLRAIDQDLAYLVGQESALDSADVEPAAKQAKAEQLRSLSADLRTLTGQIDSFRSGRHQDG